MPANEIQHILKCHIFQQLLISSSVSCFDFFLVLTAKSVRSEAGGWQRVCETHRSPLSGAFSRRSEELNDLEIIRRPPRSNSKDALLTSRLFLLGILEVLSSDCSRDVFFLFGFKPETCYRQVSWQHRWHQKTQHMQCKSTSKPVAAKLVTFSDFFSDDVVLQTLTFAISFFLKWATVIRSMFSRVSLLPEHSKQTNAFVTDAMGITGWRRGRRWERVHDLKCTYDFGERCFSSFVCVRSDASVFSVRQRSRLITCSQFGFLDAAQRSHEGGALRVPLRSFIPCWAAWWATLFKQYFHRTDAHWGFWSEDKVWETGWQCFLVFLFIFSPVVPHLFFQVFYYIN